MLQKRAGRAIVIGGSIAGLLAARALSDVFNEVIIMEADASPDGPTPRSKVPQSYHSHILLERGQEILERLFPGIIQEMIQNGSVVTDFTNDLQWFHFGQWKQRFHSGIRAVQQTRPFIEHHVRERVEEIPNVSIQYRSRVTGIIVSEDKKDVQGVKVRDEASGHEEAMPGDLVVEASGAGAQALKWLNIDTDASEVVQINLFYATRFYSNDGVDRGWSNLMISAQLPEQPYAGVVIPFENGQIGVTLGGYLQEPPQTEEEFEQIAKRLPQPDIYRFIQQATPISEMKIYKISSQSRKRKDMIDKLPRRFIMIGDAYCRFDPLYGQGMTVAAMEAEILHAELERMLNGESMDTVVRSYWNKLPKLTDDPWSMALVEAYRHPAIVGKRPFGIGVQKWFTKKIYQASAHDSLVYLRLAQVMNLKRSSTAFFRVSMLRRIFRGK
ncbi:monooxygenase FAD-binding [Paenibacillus curdlanolyticus YK9]|uniref:Monooxygenase FAD-binding n=1 Tax=Paenibacillus curdlanolyticus YK9 TaxID=717606 RepID=E0ID53_9BACL|nr:FAD-dependent monooxygenase [Paenibacillus curdlanolyticus]EFM09508.1 monooxygenase FAD-binding [Paenibacillus curdlanolyticus YK9]